MGTMRWIWKLQIALEGQDRPSALGRAPDLGQDTLAQPPAGQHVSGLDDLIRLLTGPVVDHHPPTSDEIGGTAAGDGEYYIKIPRDGHIYRRVTQ